MVSIANIRVILEREAPISFLDLMSGCARADSQSWVRIPHTCSRVIRHRYCPCFSFRTWTQRTNTFRRSRQERLALERASANRNGLAGNHFDVLKFIIWQNWVCSTSKYSLLLLLQSNVAPLPSWTLFQRNRKGRATPPILFLKRARTGFAMIFFPTRYLSQNLPSHAYLRYRFKSRSVDKLNDGWRESAASNKPPNYCNFLWSRSNASKWKQEVSTNWVSESWLAPSYYAWDWS